MNRGFEGDNMASPMNLVFQACAFAGCETGNHVCMDLRVLGKSVKRDIMWWWGGRGGRGVLGGGKRVT